MHGTGRNRLNDYCCPVEIPYSPHRLNSEVAARPYLPAAIHGLAVAALARGDFVGGERSGGG
jgi:hypothetical protein